MSSNYCVIPECYIDSCLIEVLLVADKNHVNHQKGNGTVAKEMKETFENEFCIGIIDEDRRDLDYLSEFDLVKETESLKLWKNKTKHQYIIQVRPVVEEWILNICNNENIDLSEFSLPEELKQFKRESKSISSKTDVRFISLFKKIKKTNCEPVDRLKYWLTYLKDKKYNVDINELKNA
jgi:hypothetical protein